MHLVERAVHEAREIAFDEELLADQEAHQAADRAVLAERDQRAEIAIGEGLERRPANRRWSCRTRCVGLLMGRLGARRHRAGTGHGQEAQSPIAKMSASRVVCSVGVTTSWLIAVGLEPVELAQHVRRLDAGRPHHQLGGTNSPSASLTPPA